MTDLTTRLREHQAQLVKWNMPETADLLGEAADRLKALEVAAREVLDEELSHLPESDCPCGRCAKVIALRALLPED
jgi:hypothetical protein